MSDSPYNTVDSEDVGSNVDMSGMGDHDSLYSNPEKAAEHLVDKYGVEEAREYFEEQDYDEERIEELLRGVSSDAGNEVEGDIVDPSPTEKSQEQAADLLLDAIKKSSWWEATEYDGSNLSKAPGIWRHGTQVPEYVQDLLTQVIDGSNWDWGQFDSLSHGEAQELQEMLEEKLTQPQGWSLESITRDIQQEFGLAERSAIGVAADTTHDVLNVTREQAYEEMEGSEEFEYDWIGPDDHRTTPVCEEIKAEIEDRGGSVTKPTLKQILRQKAQKYEGTSEGGGTPQRVDQYAPHYRCRHAFVREVQSI